MRRPTRLPTALLATALVLTEPVAHWSAMAATPAEKITVLHDRVMDPKAKLSASDTLTQLDEIDVKTGSRDAGRVDLIRALIESKVGPPEDAIRHGENALAIDATQPFMETKERLHLEYDVATLQIAKQDCGDAIAHYRKALLLMTPDNGVTQDQRLGTQQQIAYCLHETKDYAAAKAMNLEVLADGAKLHGADSPLLIGGLVNLAQNQYELGDHPGARASLEQVLKIATAAGDSGKQEVSLFQLGVLAFEDGRKDEAESLLQRRLDLAKASGDADRLAAAQADLDELHRKLGK